jgi:hypothetical protein
LQQVLRLTGGELRIMAQTLGQCLQQRARPDLLVFPQLFIEGRVGRGARLSQQVQAEVA